MTVRDPLEKKSGCDPQGVWRQDELIGGKPPNLWLWLLGFSQWVSEQLVGELVSEWDNSWGTVVVICCCEKLVAEAGDNSGPRGRGTSAVGSRYKKTGEDRTCWEDLSVCPSEL
jgi:hypothetical protein